LDTGLFKQLPNEFGAFGAVVVEGDECVTM
jgi:hypothetical protein